VDEVEMWQKRDPMIRLRNFLEQRDLWSQEKEEEQLAVAAVTVSAVVKNAEEIDAPTATDFFDCMYTELPKQLKLQRQTMRTSSLGQDPSQVDIPSQEEVTKNG
jgi:pyruvate dehydrogenase E1 component alpha subunit